MSDTIRLGEVCDICKSIDRKRRRLDKMERDVRRWTQEGGRTATIERTIGEINDLRNIIYEMREAHDNAANPLRQVW